MMVRQVLSMHAVSKAAPSFCILPNRQIPNAHTFMGMHSFIQYYKQNEYFSVCVVVNQISNLYSTVSLKVFNPPCLTYPKFAENTQKGYSLRS